MIYYFKIKLTHYYYFLKNNLVLGVFLSISPPSNLVKYTTTSTSLSSFCNYNRIINLLINLNIIK